MSIFIETLKGNKTRTPIWLMRQAGRHLPEYIKIRQKHKELMEMFLDSEVITEISLQPVKRYGLDACIVFSDILMIPYASGCDVSFKEGVGPQVKFNEKFKFESHKLDPVTKGIEKIKKISDTPLIGFVGGPWTTLLYCLFDKEERSQMNKALVNKNEKRIDNHIDVLVDIISDYAMQQVNAGIDAFQIFESAAEDLEDEYFDRWCLSPTQKIVTSIKSKTDIPIIGFPRKTSKEGYKKYSNIDKLDCISLDYDFDLDCINELNSNIVFQGNLNPAALLAENNILQDEVNKILIAFKDRAHIFNLGHGVLPNTSIKKVEELVNTIRGK
tara:strand:- start:143 stop:1126 length:984 start_codon:yes stop_codon:yes gene_type:complete